MSPLLSRFILHAVDGPPGDNYLLSPPRNYAFLSLDKKKLGGIIEKPKKAVSRKCIGLLIDRGNTHPWVFPAGACRRYRGATAVLTHAVGTLYILILSPYKCFTVYKVPLGDGVDLLSRGGRKSKRGKVRRSNDTCTGLTCSTACAAAGMLRVPGMRFDDVCMTGGLGVFTLSWFDLLLLRTSNTHITNRGYDWHKGGSLEHRCRCTAVAVLLLYCCCTVVYHN